jgi:hypothetical protein
MPSFTDSNQGLIINQDFGTYTVNRVLGQEYVEREYSSFPLNQMVQGDAIKYGSPVGVNAIVIQFNQNANNLLSSILAVYSDSDWYKGRIAGQGYDIYQKSNPSNRVAIWTSNNYLILIHTSDGFHGDTQDIADAYMSKYPSTLN